MHSLSSIISLLLAWCWVVSGVPVGEEAVENDVEILLRQLPLGGYIISFDENRKPFVYANITDDSLINTTVAAVDPLTSTNPKNTHPAQNLARTMDQWGCINGEVVESNCYDMAAALMATWCGNGNKVPKHSLLSWIGCQDVQVYICNYKYAQNCLGSELINYMSGTIDPNCPSQQDKKASGWFLQGSGDKTYGRGVIGQAGSGAKVCIEW